MSHLQTEFTLLPGGTPLRQLVFSNVTKGTISNTIQLRVRNVSAGPPITLYSVRFVAKLVTGGFTGSNDDGFEAMTERWLEVRRVGDVAWVPIGGVYGSSGAGNYFALSDLAPGQYHDLEARLNVPAGAATQRYARLRVGLSFRRTP